MTPSVVTVFAATQIFTALLLHRTPGWSPVGMYFTVTVPPSFPASREGRRILRRFRVRVWAHCAISLALCLAVVASGRTVWLVPALLWLPVFSLAAVAQARRRVLPHAAPASLIREASLVPQRTALPGGPLAQAGPFLILAGAALVLWAQRNALHAITTTGSRAMPDGFPFGMLAVATLSCGVVLGTALLTQRWARDPYPAVRLALLGVLLGVETSRDGEGNSTTTNSSSTTSVSEDGEVWTHTSTTTTTCDSSNSCSTTMTDSSGGTRCDETADDCAAAPTPPTATPTTSRSRRRRRSWPPP